MTRITDKRGDSDPRSAVDRDAEESAARSDRSANWMMFAMIACCAAVPLALVVVAVAGGSTFSSVGPWGWAILIAAFVAAMALVHRMATREGR